jgi:Ca2+-binding EF-hand superfamily protein
MSRYFARYRRYEGAHPLVLPEIRRTASGSLFRMPWLLGALFLLPLAGVAQEGRFAAADTDQNGRLSRAEVKQELPRLATHFDEIDSNRDGELAADELRAWSRNRKDRRGSTGGGLADYFRRADSDRDGSLTRDEAEKALPRIAAKFERIDTDHNARLTQEELRRYFDARRAARSKPPG